MSQATETAQSVEGAAPEIPLEDNEEPDEWYRSDVLLSLKVAMSDEINTGTGGFSALAALVFPRVFLD